MNGSADAGAEKRAIVGVAALSFALIAYLFWLLYFRRGSAEVPPWTAHLPAVNAFLNFSAAVFLSLGFFSIRRGKRELHRKLMLTGVAIAGLFLASYIVYHHYHGDTRFSGVGPVRPVYFFILVSHISMSVVGLPLVLTTLFFALTERFDRHRRLARFTYPVWLYVSITGVLVFFFLKVYG